MAVKLLSCVCGNYVIPQRYILCLMVFLGVVVSYSMRVCLHIAITKMVLPVVQNETDENKGKVCVGSSGHDEKIDQEGIYNWTEKQQGTILASFFPGYVITHLPGGIVSDVFGGKHILSAGVAISALITVLTPVTVHYGSWWYITIMRFIMGLAQGPLFPALTTLLARWVPARERSTLGALVVTGAQVGTITGNLITSILIAYGGGWPNAFYFWGLISVVWYIFFFVFCYSDPAHHPFITTEEAILLEEDIGIPTKMKIPWKKILLDVSVWALIIGEVGHDWIFFLIVVELPKYMSDVIKLNIKQNGVLNSVPYLALWICSSISGVTADVLINKGIMSIVNIRRVTTTIGQMAPATCIVIASYMGCNTTAVAAMFILAMFFMGPFYAGLRVNALDITKNFAGVVMAMVNGVGALAFIPIPEIVAYVASDYEIGQWRIVFWTLFFGVLITNIVYVICCSGERAEWDKNPSEQ